MCQACAVPTRAVKLVKVDGDQEDFADLIGAKGKLHLPGKGKPNNWFSGNGDVLALAVKDVAEADGKIVVKTGLGNTFTFQVA